MKEISRENSTGTAHAKMTRDRHRLSDERPPPFEQTDGRRFARNETAAA